MECARRRLARRLSAVRSRRLARAMLGNVGLLAAAAARHFPPGRAREPQVYAYAAEQQCYALAFASVAALKGAVRAADPEFRRSYSALVLRVLAALPRQFVPPDCVARPPAELSAAAAECAAAVAERQGVRVDFKDSLTESCRRCGSKKITVRSYQTRSTDEAPTIANTCNSCGHFWRH